MKWMRTEALLSLITIAMAFLSGVLVLSVRNGPSLGLTVPVLQQEIRKFATTNKPIESFRTDRVNRAGGDEPEVVQVRLIGSKATAYKYGDKAAVKEFNGPERLSAGDYMASITYREAEEFGGLQIRRTSSTKVPFSVKP